MRSESGWLSAPFPDEPGVTEVLWFSSSGSEDMVTTFASHDLILSRSMIPNAMQAAIIPNMNRQHKRGLMTKHRLVLFDVELPSRVGRYVRMVSVPFLVVNSSDSAITTVSPSLPRSTGDDDSISPIYLLDL